MQCSLQIDYMWYFPGYLLEHTAIKANQPKETWWVDPRSEINMDMADDETNLNLIESIPQCEGHNLPNPFF